MSAELRTENRSTAKFEHYGLSRSEFAVLELIADGLADKEVARILGVSRFTVSKHVGAILRKLDAASRTEAAVKAIRAEVIA